MLESFVLSIAQTWQKKKKGSFAKADLKFQALERQKVHKKFQFFPVFDCWVHWQSQEGRIFNLIDRLSFYCMCMSALDHSGTLAPPLRAVLKKWLGGEGSARFSGWKQGLIICPNKPIKFHLWSSWLDPLPLTPLIRKLFENLVLLQLTISRNLLHKLLSNS